LKLRKFRIGIFNFTRFFRQKEATHVVLYKDSLMLSFDELFISAVRIEEGKCGPLARANGGGKADCGAHIQKINQDFSQTVAGLSCIKTLRTNGWQSRKGSQTAKSSSSGLGDPPVFFPASNSLHTEV
jgi:hypothetical protein